MHRISRHRLFNILVSDMRFDKQLKHRIPDPALYEVIDRFLDRVCSISTMVVQAQRADGEHYSLVGTFGKDEPWPEWAARHDLEEEGLVATRGAVQQAQ
jgi:hypothetical protein